MRQQSGELTLAPATNAVVAAASAARAAISVIAGLGFTCGVAALIWAITPSSGASPVQLLRGGVAAYALAHFAPVDIGAVGLSLSPMFLTALFVAMLVGSIGRGDAVPRTATDELAGIAIGTLTYAVMVGLLVGWLATPGSVNPLVGVCAGGVALVSLTVGTVIRGEALRELLVTQLPRWFIVAARSAVITVMSVVGAAAVVLVGSLAFSLGTAATLTDATTSGLGTKSVSPWLVWPTCPMRWPLPSDTSPASGSMSVAQTSRLLDPSRQTSRRSQFWRRCPRAVVGPPPDSQCC